MVHWLAIGGTLGHRALAATTTHTNTVDNVTCWEENIVRLTADTVHTCVKLCRCSPCLALYPSLRALSGLVGLGARWRLDS